MSATNVRVDLLGDVKENGMECLDLKLLSDFATFQNGFRAHHDGIG
jgi:hypothetical protein